MDSVTAAYVVVLAGTAVVAILDARADGARWPWEVGTRALLADAWELVGSWTGETYRALAGERWVRWVLRVVAAWLAVGQIVRASCHLVAAAVGGVSPTLVGGVLPTRSPVAAAEGWTAWSGRLLSFAAGCALLHVVLGYQVPATALGTAAKATLLAQPAWLLADPLIGCIERLTNHSTATTDATS
jgi:hypothetical protein